ncbi:MAG: hypothetical protein MR051_00170 [Lentisphaeria bacterium]|nr:hypothetical protein [Lentisphaeria bacterium]
MDKDLELEVKKFVAAELAKGESLSNIQTGINARFQLSMTYMEVRILASTLDVDWQALDPNAAKKAAPPAEDVSAPPPAEPAADEAVPAADETGDTVVEVSKLARPGMMLSGTVKFASGSAADWYVDSMGRLGLENLVGAKPTQEDVEKFQIELDKAVRKAMGR